MHLPAILLALLTWQLVACVGVGATNGVTRIEASATSREVLAAGPDAEGRQLRNASHRMEPALLDELRQRVVRLSRASDGDIMRSMQRMGPNYTWYLSDSDLRSPVGVLILTHGFQEHGDRVLGKRARAVAEQRPTALAMGMSMMTSDHVQLALNNLAAAGAQDIIVVPAISTRFNSVMRQWNYIFGLQDTAQFASVPRVSSQARLHVVSALEDHELVGEILLQHAIEISTNPAREEVIIVAHGPVDSTDNETQLATLSRLAKYIEKQSDYANVSAITLQDDAVPQVRAANVATLRDRVSAAGLAGHEVLIISNLLGTRTVQSSLRRDLNGLKYKFNSKGLIQHENFIRWIELSVAQAASELE